VVSGKNLIFLSLGGMVAVQATLHDHWVHTAFKHVQTALEIFANEVCVQSKN
jgi:hypothetical protein